MIQLTPLQRWAAEPCLPGCNTPGSRRMSTPGGGSCTPRSETGALLAEGAWGDQKVGRSSLCIPDTSVLSVTLG